jgi:hypothetical protein
MSTFHLTARKEEFVGGSVRKALAAEAAPVGAASLTVPAALPGTTTDTLATRPAPAATRVGVVMLSCVRNPMLGSDTYGLPILSIPHAFDFHHRLAPALGNHFLNILVDVQTL